MSTTAALLNGNAANNSAKDVSGAFSIIAVAGVFNTLGTSSDVKVTQSAVPAMTVAVGAGAAYVPYTKNSESWKVVVSNSATATLNISANSSGANRVDAIIVHLLQTAPNALKSNVAEFRVVLGTGVAALTDGAITAAIGDSNWYRLANVTVANGAVSIVNANIADTRTPVTLTGFVDTTTDQTVGGIKTFSSFPVGPNAMPTTALQLINKQYADSLILGNLSATALEAITVGKPVSISSTSNSVENLVASQFRSADAGSAAAFDTGSVSRIYSCKAAANKIAVIYRESSNWYVIAGTVATDAKTITWGVRQSISANSADVLPGATYISDDLVVFTYVTSANTLKARAASLSGTVFTFDTERSVHAATVNSCAVSTVDTNKVLIAFNDSVTFGRCSIGTLAAGVLTVDTPNEQPFFATNAVSQIATCKAASTKGLIAFRDDTAQDCSVVAVSCGSTTPAPGSTVDADTDNCTGIDCEYISDDKTIVTWDDDTNNTQEAAIVTLSGTVATVNTPLTISSGAQTTKQAVSVLSTSKAVVVNTNTSAQEVAIGTTTLTLIGGSVTVAGAAYTSPDITLVNQNGKFMITYVANATSDGTGIVYQDYNNTNLYAGIAQSTVAAGVSVSIKQTGTDSNQSGLTPGDPVVSNGIIIGKALTTTSMEIVVTPSSKFGVDAYAVDISNTDDYVINPNPLPTVLVEGMQWNVKFITANTGASTCRIGKIAPLAIKKIDGSDTVTGDISAGSQGILRYNGTNLTLMNPTPLILSAVAPVIRDYIPNTFSSPLTKFTYTLHPSSNEGWAATAGEIRIGNGVTMSNATSNAITAVLRGRSNGTSDNLRYSDGIDLTISYLFTPLAVSSGTTPAGAGDKWWFHGFGSAGTTSASGCGDITDINARIGFAHYNGRIYAITANDAAVTATDLMADPGKVKTHFLIDFTSSTTVSFYINGTLQTTITTTLPTTQDMALVYAGYDGSGSNPTFHLSPINVSESLS